MKKSTILKTFGLLSILFVFAACNKYEEGANFSLRTAKGRLANTWTLVKVTDDGEEETITGTTTYKFDKEGAFEYKYVDGSNNITLTGTWEFNSDKTKVKITVLNDTEEYEILQLKNKDLKLKDDHGGHDEIMTFEGE
ncbi:MAG: lipocalin family protein [Fluviicola sp.]